MSKFATEPLRFQTTLPVRANGVLTLKIVDKSTGKPVTSGVSIDWSETNGMIVINHISGLKPSTDYVIDVLVI